MRQLEQKRRAADAICDASWRLLEIRSDKTSRSDWDFPDTSASFTLSNTRQFVWGEQYIDELVAYMSDTAAAINTDGTLSTGPTFATLQYALTDRNFSVIGLGFEADEVGDRIRYAPYGTFTAYPAGDVTLDGSVNGGDTGAIMFASSYQADLDVNMDGSVDSLDSWRVAWLARSSKDSPAIARVARSHKTQAGFVHAAEGVLSASRKAFSWATLHANHITRRYPTHGKPVKVALTV